jgi:hypothetical protein
VLNGAGKVQDSGRRVPSVLAASYVDDAETIPLPKCRIIRHNKQLPTYKQTPMPRRKPKKSKKPNVSIGKRIRDFLFSSTGVVTLAVAFLSLVVAWYSFKTRIEISPGNLSVRDDPFTTAFTLSNSGWLSIYNVHWQVNIVDLQYVNTGWREQENSYAFTKVIPKLASGDKTTMGLPRPAVGFQDHGVNVGKMEVLCVVNYRNSFFFGGRQTFRFVCFLTPESEYHWIPYQGQTSLKNENEK